MAQEQDGSEQHDPRQRARQRAAELILGTPDLTDELADAAAQPLLDWGVAQAEGVADEMASPSTGQSAEDVDLLADRIGPLRRVIKVVNSLAADRRTLDPGQVAEELALVLDLADRLPRPPLLQARGARSLSVADLAAWQTEMDDRTFVRSVLALLRSLPGGSGDGPQPADAGVEQGSE